MIIDRKDLFDNWNDVIIKANLSKEMKGSFNLWVNGNKKFEFNTKHEDIHMNIEKRLSQIIGEEAGYIHTARSRNDQVITDFKIWIKSSTNEINNIFNISKFFFFRFA